MAMQKLVRSLDSGSCDRCGRSCGPRCERDSFRAYPTGVFLESYLFLCRECAELFAYCNQLEIPE